jgi:NAD(P)-dependent dehydrogenase (short-subunit alcohol dehydrogenase family)
MQRRSTADGASGIGLETSILFAREGARVLMLDLSQASLDRALAKVFSALPHLHPAATGAALTVGSLVCDVTREADVEAAVRAVDGWGGVDVLVNNAGIMHADDADAVGTPEKVWDLTMDVNVKGVWFGSKHAVLSLRKHGKQRGSVVNVASVVALVGSATPQLAYTASKGAVLAMTRELAIVHAREGFRFNALCPAPLK